MAAERRNGSRDQLPSAPRTCLEMILGGWGRCVLLESKGELGFERNGREIRRKKRGGSARARFL